MCFGSGFNIFINKNKILRKINQNLLSFSNKTQQKKNMK